MFVDFVNPSVFEYVEHWTPQQRVKAAKILFSICNKYQIWLGGKDAFQAGHIGVFKAYKRYGEDFIPINAVGYIKKQLQNESERMQRYVDARDNASYIDVLIIDSPDMDFNSIDLMRDIKNLLTVDEYDVFLRVVFLEQKINKQVRDKKLFISALGKIKEFLYV